MFFNNDPFDILPTMAALGVAGAMLALVAIWAGLAERPAWPWRVGTMFLALAALFSLEAYEPAALFLMVMPVTALATAIIAWRKRRSTENRTEPRFAWKMRFSLRDLLLVVLFAGVSSGLFATLWRQEAFLHFRGLLVQAAILSFLAVSVVLMTVWPRRCWWIALALGVVGIMCSIAAPRLLEFDGLGMQEQELYEQAGLPTWGYWLVSYAVYFVLLLIVFATAQLSVYLSTITSTRLVQSRRFAARSVFVVVAVAVLVPSLWVYSQMLIHAPLPDDGYPPENPYPRLLELAKEVHRLNPAETAVVELENPPDPDFANKMQRIYAEAISLLEQDGHYVLDLPREGRVKFTPGDFEIRYLARAWGAEAQSAVASGRLNRGVEYAVASIRLGNDVQRGGVLIDTLVGLATEGSGESELAKIRTDIPLDLVSPTLSRLVRIDNSREDVEVTLARERAFLDRAFTWQRRLDVAVCRLTGRGDLESERGVRSAIHRRDAKLRLIMIELAIRLFREETGRLPESLDELTPDLLVGVPVDPYSGQPFVYRREPDGYLLYSVGADGVDNGGKLMTSKNKWNDEGFDFDLDYPNRPGLPIGP